MGSSHSGCRGSHGLSRWKSSASVEARKSPWGVDGSCCRSPLHSHCAHSNVCHASTSIHCVTYHCGSGSCTRCSVDRYEVPRNSTIHGNVPRKSCDIQSALRFTATFIDRFKFGMGGRCKLYLWMGFCTMGHCAIPMDRPELRWLWNSAIEREINE